MPFTQSVGPYMGGNFLFQGLASVGDKAAEAIKMLDENRKLDSYNDTVVQHAFQNNQMSREDYDKYIGSSRTAKTGIAAGLASNFLQDYKSEQLKSLQEQRQAMAEARSAQAEERFQRAAALNWTPSKEDLDRAQWTGNELIRTGPGKYSLAAYGGADGVTGDPQAKRLTIGDQPVPGWVVVSKPGSKQFQVLPEQHPGFVQDPKTKGWGVLGPKNNFVPLTSAQQQALMMEGVTLPGAEPPPSPTPAGPSLLDNILGAMGGGSGGPQPTATPTPQAIQQQLNNVSVAPIQTPAPQAAEAVPVTATGPVPPAQVQAAAIKEAFKAGKMSRDEAMKALRALGYQ